MKNTHESYGNIAINKFQSNQAEFFGSDIYHSGGISITISQAETERGYGRNRIYPRDQVIRVEMSYNQFVDAITSGMNTQGVPCTIRRIGKDSIPQVPHVEDKTKLFSQDMQDMYKEFQISIDSILNQLDGNIGKKKLAEIKIKLESLKMNISSNTNFVMDTFTESMNDTVKEAKQSIASYVEHRVNSLGIEALRDQFAIELKDNSETKLIEK